MEKTPINEISWLSTKDLKWIQQTPWVWHRPNSRRLLKFVTAVLIFVFCLRTLSPHSIYQYLPIAPPNELYLERGLFEPLPIAGFINTGSPGKIACDELEHVGQLSVQESFHLTDDMYEIAKSLEHHPMIDYSGQDKDLTWEEMIDKTWLRMAQSSVWLERYQVFLTVSRVLFYDKGVKHWPVISFLRGQIFDENWVEQKDYKLVWQGQEIHFPRIFDIPVPYIPGDAFFGPEDPRVIIEEGVRNAEPVVIFNMVNDLKQKTRAMHIFRPFSNDSTVLTIVGQKERAAAEKNWQPFFHRTTDVISKQQWPSTYLHFVHSFKPLKILKCHLLNGWCEMVYEQKIPDDFAERHNDTRGRMSGGTNFVSLNMKSGHGVHAYVGFPRTHIDVGCRDESMYRPNLMIMTATGTHFHLDYMSDSIDFGTSAMDEEALADPCGEGRILIANSIARWDRKARQDVMTITFTVDDSTTQVLRLHGVWDFIQRLPHLTKSLMHDVAHGGEALWNLRWSAVGNDVLACSVEAAQNYSISVSGPTDGKDIRKQREEADKRKTERLKKEKERLKEELKKQQGEEAEKSKKEKEAEKEKEKLKEIEKENEELAKQVKEEMEQEKEKEKQQQQIEGNDE